MESSEMANKRAHPDASGLKRRQTIGYFAAFAILGVVVASLGPTLPGLAAHTGSEIDEISFLFVARSFGTLLGALLAGRLFDRRPGHPILVVTLLVIALMLFLAPLLPWLGVLALVLLLLGLSEGTVDVGTNTMLVWVHSANVGPFMNGLHFFFGAGAFLSPIVVAEALRRTGDITLAYWALALLVLPVALWFLRLPGPAVLSVSGEDGDGSHDLWLVVLVGLFLALYVGAEVSFGGWIFSYVTALALAGEATAAYLTSAFWGSFTLGRLLSIPLAARWQPRTVLLADLAGALLSLGILLLWPQSLAALWAGTLGMGLTLAAIFPTTLSLAGRRMAINGRITGWFFVGASLGAMTIPWLVGQLFAAAGPQMTMVAILVDLLVAVAICALLLWRSAPREPRPQLMIRP